jgi:sulfofructose kinase
MNASPRVLCCGMAVLDRIMRVGAFHSGGGKIYTSDYHEVGGGPAATAAVAIARLGGSVGLVARVGDDGAGRRSSMNCAPMASMSPTSRG